MSTRILAAAVPLSIALLSSLAAGPCTEQRSLPGGLGGFQVTITGTNATGGNGTRADPYDVPRGDLRLDFAVQALDMHGQPMSWDGAVSLSVAPGTVVSPQQVAVTGGQASASVTVRKVFGHVTLWVEDRRWVDGDVATGGVDYPLKRTEGTYRTGVSAPLVFRFPSLQHLQIDPWIYESGEGLNDLSSLAGAFVELDCKTDAGGPLPTGHGQVLVTGIFGEGFFVTDLAPAANPSPVPPGFNHLYVYSYSYPENLEEGDRLDQLMGTAQDFSGASQISFPVWKRAETAAHDPLPFRIPATEMDTRVPPTPITRQLCDENNTASTMHLCGYSKQAWGLEALESARVRLTDLKLPDLLVNCDFNANTEITSSYPHPDLETECRDACLERDGATEIVAKEIIFRPEDLATLAVDPCTSGNQCASGVCGDQGMCMEVCPFEAVIEDIQPNCMRIHVNSNFVCSELSTLRQFGQWTAATEFGAGPLINLLTRDSVPDFEPSALPNLGRRIDSALGDQLQGNLRQVRAARPRWIVLVGILPNDMPAWMRP